ncbi:unnamed protein product [Adineta steineri]|uniref:C2 domain-containing protein n=2 Tax=Adineta steineri TaxID=433720 RepID=A0A814REL9_9BILA|nr:unnamed protein product [Adineta steineri]
MLSSLKKWVQDVTVDLAPPPRSSPSSSSIPESTHHYFYSTTPFNEHHESRYSTSSAVYISKPVSMDSMRSSRASTILMPPPVITPAEIDLSHLNREEQEHIANVLRRARAVDEQQSPLLPVTTTVPSTMSPAASISPSSSSSSTSTNSFVSDKLEKYDNEINNEVEKFLTSQESTLTTIIHQQCQICGKIQKENFSICSQCEENKSIDYKLENNITFTNQQPTSIKKTLSPISATTNHNNNEGDRIYDNIMTIEQEIQDRNYNSYTKNHVEQNSDQSIISDLSRTNNLTEIDENEFFYEEPSPYITSNKIEEQQQIISSYKIEEDIDEDNHDEHDHVKELEKTIENLSRYIPLEEIERNNSSILPGKKNVTNLILEMEIDSPSANEFSSHPPTHPLSLSISVPSPINNRRGSLSRSNGIRENLTDLLIPAIPESYQSIQKISSTFNKRMLSPNRHKRNLPSVPNFTPLTQLQLRRANSESRFTLPAVPIMNSQQNLDDESDLLEIDLTDPIGSMNRTLSSKFEYESKPSIVNNQHLSMSNDNFKSKIKQLRDQTTNTPPLSSLKLSMKSSKKKLRKKDISPLSNIIESLASPINPPTRKLQKSTSTEITYPFPITKLILNPSRHNTSTGLGFRITGGHSIAHCMEVTAIIENINTNHRNYQILKNVVQEGLFYFPKKQPNFHYEFTGDEVLELGGVSLRGKSALFVENLMNTIQNEFEIIVRKQSTNTFVTTDNNIQRRHSIDILKLAPTNNTVTKSKSTSICSLQKKTIESNDISKQEGDKLLPTNILTSTEESSNLFSHRPRSSLLPNDPGLNGAGSNLSIERENSNESDECDSLSQYFQTSQNQLDHSMVKLLSHGRSQSVIPIASDRMTTSRHLQNFLKSDNKQRAARGSTSIERKSSLALSSLKFLKKKTKSVDFSSQNNVIVNQLRENDYAGDIEIQIGHNSEREQLVVRIIQAKNLLPKDANGFSDPFVKIYLLPGRDQENKRRIKHVSKTLNPAWDQTVTYGHMHREELQYKKLEFTVWDYDRFKANDFLGQVTIDLKNPKVIDDKSHWYRLQALRSREEATNRGSSPRLFKMISADSSASSLSTVNKNSVNIQPRIITPLK